MKKILQLGVAVAALIGLSACDQLGLGAADNKAASNEAGKAAGNASNGAEANESAAAGDKDPVPGGGAGAEFTGTASRAWLIGRWTDTGDCAVVTDFQRDGTFVAPNGNQGIWTLNGSRLIFQGERQMTIEVEAVDENTLIATLPDGTIGRSTRC